MRRMRLPSSSRMFVFTLLAMKRATFSGSSTRSASAFFRRMATLVSMSGAWMSAIRPHSKRLCRRSSMVGIWRGGQSELITICFCASCSALKMWKNSSWVRSLPAMNWMSSTSRTSIERYFWRKDGKPVEPDRVDHLVDEAVGRDVEDVELLLPGEDVVPDRVHEVGLPQAHPAVDEEGVVRLRGDLRHRPGRGVGELVGGADHEALERVLRVERRGVPLHGRHGRRRRRPRPRRSPRRRPAARAGPPRRGLLEGRRGSSW